MNREIPTYKVIISEDFNTEEGVDMISLVTDPAIKVNWVAFSKQDQQKYTFTETKDQQKLAGPFLIPDMPIYRKDDDGFEYYIVFGKEEILKISEKFNKLQKTANVNYQHLDDSKLNFVFVAQNWLTEDVDKSQKYGFNLPVGTWFGIVKVENSEFWSDEVKTENIKGFSVEALIGLEKIINKQIEEMKKTTKLKSLKLEDLGVSAYVELPVGKWVIGDKEYTVEEKVENEGTQDEYRYNVITAIVPTGDAPVDEVPVEQEEELTTEVVETNFELTPDDMNAIITALQPTFDELAVRIQALEKWANGVDVTSTEMSATLTKLSNSPAGVSKLKLDDKKEEKSINAKMSLEDQVKRINEMKKAADKLKK